MGEIVSFGAGINSTAMIIMLVNEGWRGPIVFADTGTEWPETYCFTTYFANTWLAPRGLAVTVLGADYRALVPGRDMRTLIEYCEHYRVTPFPATRWCTAGWKTDVLDHWCAAHGNPTQLIGMAADEAHRQKGRACPLIDRGIDRKGCVRIIQAEGLDVPQKSGCWICPFMSKRQWRDLYRRHPDLFERAARLEEAATERRGVKASIHPDFTLREIEVTFRDQRAFLDADEMDSLLEYRPCICSL
jgi:3'-phosphoadenosine 5'-phosphosulfate sulfotransferase (PAPS reductase)/FAD synthetase